LPSLYIWSIFLDTVAARQAFSICNRNFSLLKESRNHVFVIHSAGINTLLYVDSLQLQTVVVPSRKLH